MVKTSDCLVQSIVTNGSFAAGLVALINITEVASCQQISNARSKIIDLFSGLLFRCRSNANRDDDNDHRCNRYALSKAWRRNGSTNVFPFVATIVGAPALNPDLICSLRRRCPRLAIHLPERLRPSVSVSPRREGFRLDDHNETAVMDRPNLALLGR